MHHRLFSGLMALLALAAVAAPLSAQAQSRDASFTLVNRGQVPVRELYVTPAGDANWGQNRLNRGALPPGGRFEVLRRRDGNCILDMRAVFADGHAEDRRGLNTCTLDAVAVGNPASSPLGKQASDPSFRLINRGDTAIAELFATPAGMTNWGQNRLPDGPLPQAAERMVRIPRSGDCLFDLRVVFDGGKALVKRRTNLCRTTELAVP